jgi:hypothetical protein
MCPSITAKGDRCDDIFHAFFIVLLDFYHHKRLALFLDMNKMIFLLFSRSFFDFADIRFPD